MQFYVDGSTSLLFIISTLKAFYVSKLISWKISNLFLIGASFLCNATKYEPLFLLLDYFAIFLVCISYINNYYVAVLYTSFLISEYCRYKSIEMVKNIAFGTAVGKSIFNTFVHVDLYHFNVLLFSSFISLIAYKIRYDLHSKQIRKYTLFLTFVLHLSVMIIIYISSLTAY